MEATLKKPIVSKNERKIAMTLFLIGIFMGALDHGIVGPALSSIVFTYNIDTSWGVWSFTIYTLLFAVSIPLMGKFSDRFGRKLIFIVGIGLFGIGSLFAALAPNFVLFLIGRSIQAIGTGGIFPITAAFIAVSYPEETRAKAMGMIGLIFGFGSILGPMVGGYIIQNFDWQWIFLINVPIAILVVVLMSFVKIQQQIIKNPIDYKGIMLLTAIILSIMLGITTVNIYVLIIGVILIPIMIFVEKTAPDPIIKIHFFKQKNTLIILFYSAVSGVIMASTINLLPIFIETEMMISKASAALGVAPLAITSMIASVVGGQMVTKIGAKKVLFIGFLLTTIGTLLLINPINYSYVLVVSAIIGFGIGIIIGAPLNILIIQETPISEAGTSVGFLSLFRSLGSTVGPTIAGIMIASSADGFAYISIFLASVSIISLIIFAIFKK
ncbi:MFS transporter [Cytobacillus sp. IB215316]|uniref:MFS transporter n=1 Tax=Cytobacillus sp. IB215316 TaxID=3097354 RepID=UPI002A1089D7|nr:MFS transporter [Cytobacillus sp. IB215316]MDX8362565.1 MFS transporter [Cytobacillus sp. IB215316]